MSIELYIAQQLINAISLGSLYALVAIGLSLIFGILRMANFAHGDMMMVGAFATLVLQWLGGGNDTFGFAARTLLGGGRAESTGTVQILDRGRLIYDGDVPSLKSRFGKERVLVVDLEETAPPLRLAGARVVRVEGPRQWIAFDGDRTSAAELTGAVAAQAPLRDLTVEEPEIEDVVRRIYEEQPE